MITPEMIQAVRWEISDNSVELPILSDTEYTYFLQKNQESIRRASLDAAKTILFKLSQTAGRRTVDILSIDSTKAATAYKEALMAYIKNPELSGALQNVVPYAGGVSKSDMQANIDNSDVNAVIPPLSKVTPSNLTFFNL